MVPGTPGRTRPPLLHATPQVQPGVYKVAFFLGGGAYILSNFFFRHIQKKIVKFLVVNFILRAFLVMKCYL